jgi:DNA-binding CsgD family transcriptional regulator
VGRRTELAFLTDVLVPGSGPRVVVLVGEAGVGKTRLAAEAVRRARAAGTTVLLGACLPLTDSVPFLPITEALRGLRSAGGKPGPPEVLERCAPHVRAELVRLIPGWSASPQPGTPGPVEGWQRGRLFLALRDLLTMLAAEGHCAVVVEDLHWADGTTLDFLAYLCAADRDGIVPVVLTCREEEIEPKRPVGRWFAELARQEGVVQLPLSRLSHPEVAEQIRGLLGAAAPASFVDEVYARAEGNAFFTEQLVANTSGSTPGLALPRSLAQLLIVQAEAIGEDSRSVLTTLAVAGRGLDESVLVSITGLTGPRLRLAVRELADARLIDRPGNDSRYRLRHALVGEAVVADMLDGDRRERHATVARVLGTRAAADGSGEVAEHWAAAGDADEEMPWRVTAAGEAEHVYAYREAARHWLRVIDLWPRVPPGVRPAVDLAAAYLSATGALDRCGDTRKAGVVAEHAIPTLPRTADRRNLALLYERAALYREMEDDPTALQPLDVALGLLADLPPGREHARILRQYGEMLFGRGRSGEARSYLERARQACRSDATVLEEASILRGLAFIDFDDGDVSAGMRRLGEAAALVDRNDDDRARLAVAIGRTQTLLELGRLEDTAVEARAGLATAQRAGLEQDSETQLILSFLADALIELGRPSEAVSETLAVTEVPPTSGASYDHMTRALLDMLAGDLAAATTRWAAIEAVCHTGNLRYGGNLVDRGAIDLWAHRPAEALSRIQQVPEGINEARYRGFTAPILTTALRACADLAEAARASRDPAGEEAARRAAQELVDRHEAMEPDPFAPHPYHVTATAHGATWAAELTRVHGTSDPDAWAAAAAAWTRLGRPYRTAYAQWRQAEALLAGGRTTEARHCLREAAAAAETHAPLLAEIRSLARLARLDLHHQQAPPDSPQLPEPSPYGLTPREMAVLRLVADGLTNTQIGTRLFISEKTASVHVTNILRKLDVKNRAQAAALAQRAGLLAPLAGPLG